jgi:hypothetical protein
MAFYLRLSSLKQAWLGKAQIKNPHALPAGFYNLCGGRGIRTPGTLRYNGFQDRRIRPLCHSSGREISKKLECEDEKNQDNSLYWNVIRRNC